ncbi:hypothetical protein NA57DRAFT_67922 [Rhizodiscina lignyota]|uniref:Septin-type G domain-containing protein n=1 Tax=Rhizodiscina lignyota TaxID=1504668 RepID=A0A9P4M5Q4_9PEZI|nr:hypothetical protein NA57DRAFT_67922 [Rhizodiscina lignyota]
MPPSVHSRSRKSSIAESPANHAAAPTSFFIASEDQMEKAMARQDTRRTSVSSAHNGMVNKEKEIAKPGQITSEQVNNGGSSEGSGTYGVQSLEEAIGAAFGSDSSKENGQTLSRSGSAKSRSSDGSAEGGKKRKRKCQSARQGVSEPNDGTETPKDCGSTHSSPQPPQPVPSGHARRLSPTTMSTPLTPICIDSPAYHADSGIPSTPKSVSLRSLRLSDDGEHEDPEMNDAASQAIVSTDDEDDAELEQTQHSSFVPELVMPSITMPARRPFTESGKRLGRLKIMVVGPEGMGKTGLIRSIVQICEDIVHVDQTPVPVSAGRTGGKTLTRITEIHASTRAYPSWWSDVEESRILRRRKSMGLGDTVLERNVCFIDTPGFGDERGLVEENNARYIEALMHRNAAVENLSDADLLNMLSSGGGVQVDVVLYIFGHESITEQDLASFARIAALTNVVPLIGKSDLLSQAELVSLKHQILGKLQGITSRPFLFGNTIEESLTRYASIQADSQPLPHQDTPSDDLQASQPQTQAADVTPEALTSVSNYVRDSESPLARITFPYAISSAPGPDLETMDASLLMSPDYCPPPLPSELHLLVELLFDPEKAAWLRHTSARKFLSWRHEIISNSMDIMRNPTLRISGTRPPSSLWKIGGGIPSSATGALTPSHGLLSFAQRNTASQRPNVPRWAANLSKALRNERERDGKIVWDVDDPEMQTTPLQGSALWSDTQSHKSGSSKKKGSKISRKGGRHWSDSATPHGSQTLKKNGRDPLDVLSAVERVSNVAWTAVKVLGAVSAAGAVACVVARTFFGVESVTVQWHWG